jgi:hypothetical protein
MTTVKITKTLASLALLASLLLHAAPSAAIVPAQFIAKIYTEALGRIPDQGGWSSAVTYFQQNGCSRGTLATWGTSALTSAEFTGLGYDNAAFLLILYRATLDREPDTGGYNYWYGQLQNGLSRSQMIANSFNSTEFVNLVSFICSGSGSYSFERQGPGMAMQIPTNIPGGYGNISQAQLQALLNSTASGGTVYLQQESVVYLTSSLSIPTGVTLATYGNPPPHQHGFMARLIRAAAFTSPMVQLAADTTASNAALRNIWVDGQRAYASTYTQSAINIEIYGGSNVVVDSNFIDNTLGWSSLHTFGSLDGRPCAGNTITNNTITVYPSSHHNSQWADGLSIGCENSTVSGNGIVDPTDVGIVVFNAYPAVQKSNVQSNSILSAGNSAFGAMGFDPLQGRSPNPDFTGASISNNTFWGGPNTHFVIGLAVGSRPWFVSGQVGTGATAVGNTTGTVRTVMGEGIAVSGMWNATVQSNTFLATPYSQTSCPVGNIFVSVSAGLGSGSIQGPYTDADLSGCMSDFGSGS